MTTELKLIENLTAQLDAQRELAIIYDKIRIADENIIRIQEQEIKTLKKLNKLTND